MKNMKKTVATLLVVIMVACGCAAASAGNKALTPDEAKMIALNYAGLTMDSVTFTKCHQDRDDGRLVYEIEFISGGIEYDLDVDLYTGRVTDTDRDIPDRFDRDDDFDDYFDFD